MNLPFYWRTWLRFPCIAACLALATQLGACTQQNSNAAEKKSAGGPAIPVVVAPVMKKTVPLRVEAIGNVEPYATVSVKARVDGQIVKVFFTDGQEVVAGQPMFQLDPRPFQAALQQAEAALLRDKAQLDRARTQQERYQDLLHKNFVSPDAYAQFVTNADTAAASVRASEAALESARLQLEYSTIRAPISGRTGKIMIQLGNLVKANDTVSLVVINQVAPVYLSFAVPEQYLGQIRQYMVEGKLAVEARIQGVQNSALGELAFIDNTVDVGTGTVKLRAVFPNKDRVLWPGQFVTAAVTLREEHDALVVPSRAVQTGPRGSFVFVVKPDLAAEVREVAVERIEGDQSVIAKGLAAGERVVVDGQSRLVAGSRVNPKADAGKS
jgi:multidrug efflux system membrane fusion protein